VISPRNPFDLDDNTAYTAWCEEKLAGYPRRSDELIVEVRDPRVLTPAEHAELHRLLRQTNMAIYAGGTGDDPDKDIVRELGQQFGLRRLDHNMCADDDAITSLRVASDALHQGYIPYTDRPIAWHTDGYYNGPEQQIRGLILHCVQPADEGGANRLFDPELAYIELRDENPDYIRALGEPDAMTIPANRVDGEELRPARTGPVFSLGRDGRLHMRYTARKRNVVWADDPVLAEAVEALHRILEHDTPYRFETRLAPGQGLISNNCLHTRSAFRNGEHERLIYRARYYDRIAGT
jgi:alpha-ketoglutarate-dependent taurine dioxygenase